MISVQISQISLPEDCWFERFCLLRSLLKKFKSNNKKLRILKRLNWLTRRPKKQWKVKMISSEFTATNFMEMKVLTLTFSWSTRFAFVHLTKCLMVLRKQSSSSSKAVFNLAQLKVKTCKLMLKMLFKNLGLSGRNFLMNAYEFSTLTCRKTFSSSLLKNISRKNDM